MYFRIIFCCFMRVKLQNLICLYFQFLLSLKKKKEYNVVVLQVSSEELHNSFYCFKSLLTTRYCFFNNLEKRKSLKEIQLT